MLQAIRGKAGSWIVKILFVFLIVSFAIWGVGDIFRNQGADQTVAEVGDREISVDEFDAAMRRARQQSGGQLDLLLQAGLEGQVKQMVLQSLVNDAVFEETAFEQGLIPSQQTAAARIRSLPGLKDPVTGAFSRDRLIGLLQNNQISEQGFVDQIRRQLAREEVRATATLGTGAPATLADALLRYRGEKRSITLLTVDPAAFTDIPEPTGQDLADFHQAHAAQFTAPEYRKLAVVALTPDQVADKITISDNDLRAAYDARAASLTPPETRAFDQVLVSDQAAAQAIADAARAGGSLKDAAAQAAGGPVPVIPIQETTRDGMPVPALADAGFALPENGVSDPVQSPFGWHVLQVTALHPSVTPPFEQVRDQIEHDLKLEQASDQLYELGNQLLDLLAGGTTMEEAAQQLGVAFIAPAPVSRNGEMADGSAPPDIAGFDQMVATAFSLEEGQESDLVEIRQEGGYFVERLDGIIDPALRPLDTIRDQVAEAWKADRRMAEAADLANTLADQLRQGHTPEEAVAGSTGVQITTVADFTRDGEGSGDLPSDLVTAIFGLDQNGVTTGVSNGKPVVARLDAVTPVDVADAGAQLDGIKTDTQSAMASDLVAQLTSALSNRHGVAVHDETLARLDYGR